MGRKLLPQLAELRGDLLPFAGRQESAFYPVMVRPTLGFCMAPRRRPTREGGPPPRNREREAILAALAPAVPGTGSAHGLVEGLKSDASPQGATRYGLRGLPCVAGLSIKDACAALNDRRHLLGFLTVTLPPEAAARLDLIPDGAQLFFRVLIRRFAEKLKRRLARQAGRLGDSVRPEYVFVIEPQENGRPHLHCVFVARWNRWRSWALGKADLDRLAGAALWSVTGEAFRTGAMCNIQRVKKNAGAYLAKYMTKGEKGTSAEKVLAGGYGPNLIPHQWWGWSVALRRLVACHTFEVPGCFVNWLSKQWPGLSAIGRIEARIYQPPDPRAPAVVVGSFPSVRALRDVVAHLDTLMRQAYDPAVTFTA